MGYYVVEANSLEEAEEKFEDNYYIFDETNENHEVRGFRYFDDDINYISNVRLLTTDDGYYDPDTKEPWGVQ